MLPIRDRSARYRCVAGALAMFGITAFGFPAGAADGPATPPSPTSTDPNPDSRHSAHVVLIAEVGSDPELASLLLELLDRQGTGAVIERAPRFDQDALFHEQERDTLGIFIALKSPREARLYFRAPGGERYLVRKLALPSGLDAVGRELLGQVVASSAEALNASTEGLSREQASAEIADESPPKTERAVETSAASPGAPSEEDSTMQAATAERDAAGWEFRALARYSAMWTGSDLGLRHGPGVAVGARFGRDLLVGIQLGGDYFFAQTFESPELDGHLQTAQFHALLAGGVRLSRASTVNLAVGPRLELSDFRPRAKNATVTTIDPNERLLGGLRLEAGYDWSSSHLVLGVVFFADVAFVRTHYDVAQPDGTATTVANMWPFRPGAALTLGVR
jgi:hypothetical protein